MTKKKIFISAIVIVLLALSLMLKDHLIFRIKLNSQGIDYRLRYDGAKIYLVIPDIHFSDLTILQGAPLCGLYIEDTAVSDLSPLKEMKLNQIFVSNTLVTNFSPLRGMPIREIRFWNTGVSDISPIINDELETVTFGNRIYDKVASVRNEENEITLDVKNETIKKTKRLINSQYQYKSKQSVAHIDNIHLLRNAKNLRTINNYPANEFIQKFEKGDYFAQVPEQFLNCRKDPQFYLNNCLIWTAVKIDGKLKEETMKNKQYIELKDISTDPVGIYRLKRGETFNGVTNVDFDTKSKIATIKFGNFSQKIPMGFSR